MNKNPIPMYGRDQDVYFAQQYHRILVELSQTERLLEDLGRDKPSFIARLRQKTGAILIELGLWLAEDNIPAEPLVLREDGA